MAIEVDRESCRGAPANGSRDFARIKILGVFPNGHEGRRSAGVGIKFAVAMKEYGIVMTFLPALTPMSEEVKEAVVEALENERAVLGESSSNSRRSSLDTSRRLCCHDKLGDACAPASP